MTTKDELMAGSRSLHRLVSRWVDCSPKEMSRMSEAAIFYAFQDARADIITLAQLLCEAGYPRRGTAEETQSIQDFAGKVQQIISHEEAVNLPANGGGERQNPAR